MPDARVQAAIDHWAPRFVQAGVDYSDFVATTAARRALGGVARRVVPRTATCTPALAEEAAAAGRACTAGEAWARATVAYHFAKFVWMVDAELSRAAADKAVAAMAKTHELPRPGRRAHRGAARRRPRGRQPAPPGGDERPPLVLLIPGLDSTKEEFFRLENVFLDARHGHALDRRPGPGRGAATTCRSGPTTRSAVAAVLDALAGRDDLDLDRVGALGVSLGGYYAPRVARLRAAHQGGRRAQRPVQRSATSGTRVPPLTRETFVAKSFAATTRRGARRPPSST